MAKKKEIPIRETLRKLESLVDKLEDDDVQLEEALAAFEEGIKLTREAQEILRKTEQRVQLLLDNDGEPQATAFTDESAE